jgi:transcriptional regulator with PAS, ATPase and Fis domain
MQSPTSTRTLTSERERALALLVSCAGKVRRYPLRTEERLAIGRDAECDVIIADASVSRRHCSVRIGAEIEVTDEGSHNGTFVWGRRLQRGESATIAPGTAFDVGAATLLVHFEQVARPPVESMRAAGATLTSLDDLLEIIAPTSLPVIIMGETGTGKDVVAEDLHRRSGRANKPMVRVNCAALHEALLESELFGHEKGAFTGAIARKDGLFRAANEGTLFLDELGEMSPTMQAKLLRVLESGEVTRVGSTTPQKVDVRIIAATHRDLSKMIERGSFRQDLFYRLNGFAIGLAPLRERRAEIPALARRLLEKNEEKSGCSVRLSDDAIERLQDHSWPGNIRELRTVLERAVVLARDGVIEPKHLLLSDGLLSARPVPLRALRAGTRLAEDEIRNALQVTSGNQKQAAKVLGVSRPTLIKYMVLYGFGRPRKGH